MLATVFFFLDLLSPAAPPLIAVDILFFLLLASMACMDIRFDVEVDGLIAFDVLLGFTLAVLVCSLENTFLSLDKGCDMLSFHEVESGLDGLMSTGVVSLSFFLLLHIVSDLLGLRRPDIK